MTINVVFDFGAVLFQWQPHLIVRRHFPVQAAVEDEARRMAMEMFHHDDWQSFDRGTVQASEVCARIAERLGLSRATVDALVADIPSHLEPMADTVALLQGLHRRRTTQNDLRLYFLSNMPAPFARHLQEKHAFLSCFDGGVFSGDVQLIKPEAAIFELLGKRHGLDPACTVFIDDLPANVEAARAFGWHALQFQSAPQLEAMLQPHIG